MRESVSLARRQLLRAASGLTAIRALANAELADPSWFRPCDLVDIVDRAVADETRQAGSKVTVEVVATDTASQPVTLWPDGAELAVANLVRNALTHGGGAAGGRVVVTVDAATVIVDDAGPGVVPDDRDRVLARFERGSAVGPGSGLGLAIADQVARAHRGSVVISESPFGGARVMLRLAL